MAKMALLRCAFFAFGFGALILTVSAEDLPTDRDFSMNPSHLQKEPPFTPSPLEPERTPAQKRAASCPSNSQCSFFDSFQKKTTRWKAAGGYANSVPFAAYWDGKNSYFKAGKLNLLVNKRGYRFGKQFAAGQLQSTKWYGYGCYEVRMKPVRQPGIISTFFTYTGKYDKAPGTPGRHQEIDIEFVLKPNGRYIMQTNYFTNGRGGHEKDISLKFDPSKGFHNYAFKWTPNRVEWYVDGKKVHSAFKNIPKVAMGGHKIMMNMWPVTSSAAGWAGHFRYRGPRTSQYEALRFTKGAGCKIRNRF